MPALEEDTFDGSVHADFAQIVCGEFFGC
jgi:hypothetical protein